MRLTRLTISCLVSDCLGYNSLFSLQCKAKGGRKRVFRTSRPFWSVIHHDAPYSQPELSLAPMMDYTDRHFRHMVRLLSKRTVLYTEMVTANAIVAQHNMVKHSNVDDQSYFRIKRFLAQSEEEDPCVLQLGGADPELLYNAVDAIYNQYTPQLCNYTAINLNCGCPSSKVAGSGCFGASLMHDPILVQQITRSMSLACDSRLPITVKCRIGTDTTHPTWKTNDNDETLYSHLHRFIETIAKDGIVNEFQIHARIAVLSKNFSPTDNREIPPLRYDIVSRLIQDFPEIKFTLNGGIRTLQQAKQHLQCIKGLHGVMVGRGFISNPWQFAMTDLSLFQTTEAPPSLNRFHLLEQYGKHADREEQMWGQTHTRRALLKPLNPLFYGEPNGKKFRIALDHIANNKQYHEPTPISQLILQAATTTISEEVLFRDRTQPI